MESRCDGNGMTVAVAVAVDFTAPLPLVGVDVVVVVVVGGVAAAIAGDAALQVLEFLDRGVEPPPLLLRPRSKLVPVRVMCERLRSGEWW